MDENFQAFIAIVNAALALGTLVLAIVVRFQGNKIRELAEIINELQKQTVVMHGSLLEFQQQTTTMNKTFLMERVSSIPDRLPFFRVTKYNDRYLDLVITMSNIGQEATDMTLRSKSESIAVQFPTGAIQRGGNVSFTISFSGTEKDNYSFSFSFRGVNGIESYQTFHKESGRNYKLDPPFDDLLFDNIK
ncbi:MAG: hypothetical protein H7Y42_14015 [Chitinophagaceae bacterium]|nr:hypothetical protein [Chitinophagaceae bacterium]